MPKATAGPAQEGQGFGYRTTRRQQFRSPVRSWGAHMLRLIAGDEAAEKAYGLKGGRRRVAPLNEETPRPPPPLPQNLGPRPTQRSPRARNERMLREMREQKRLSALERGEAYRQVRQEQVHSWLKKHSIKAVPRTELSRRRRGLLLGCFQLLDADSSGTVERQELGLAMKTLGFSESDVRDAFERCDQSNDGKLDFEEFVQLFTIAWAHREKRVAFHDAFARDMSEVRGRYARHARYAAHRASHRAHSTAARP